MMMMMIILEQGALLFGIPSSQPAVDDVLFLRLLSSIHLRLLDDIGEVDNKGC